MRRVPEGCALFFLSKFLGIPYAGKKWRHSLQLRQRRTLLRMQPRSPRKHALSAREQGRTLRVVLLFPSFFIWLRPIFCRLRKTRKVRKKDCNPQS